MLKQFVKTTWWFRKNFKTVLTYTVLYVGTYFNITFLDVDNFNCWERSMAVKFPTSLFTTTLVVTEWLRTELSTVKCNKLKIYRRDMNVLQSSNCKLKDLEDVSPFIWS